MVQKNKVVSTTLDCLNLGLSVFIALLYLWRTHDMCAFDEEPLWKVHPEQKCSGVHQTWYYIVLFVVHVYFMLEYILRLMTQKYIFKHMKSLESMIDLTTTLPFLICYVTLGT